jgi:5-methylcytosine-specific restriction protein B
MRELIEEFFTQYPIAKETPFGHNEEIWDLMNTLCDEILPNIDSIAGHPHIHIKWSVGNGNWAGVPWIALLDDRITDTTTKGRYVAYLIREDMSGFYVTFGQGTENLREEHGVTGAREILQNRVTELRDSLNFLENSDFILDDEIDLRATTVRGRSYEKSVAVYKFYERGNIPENDQLNNDLNALLNACETVSLQTSNEVTETKTLLKLIPPTNTILYGPPGTGKTYQTAARAVKLCDGEAPANRDDLMRRYRELVDSGRIDFVTFHQSYAYEDFVEGLRPKTKGKSGGFKLKPRSGIFRKIAKRAAKNTTHILTQPILDRTKQVFKIGLGDAGAGLAKPLFHEAIYEKCVMLGWGWDIDWSEPEYENQTEILQKLGEDLPAGHSVESNSTFLNRYRNQAKIGDYVIVAEGNTHFKAVGRITGDYQFVHHINGYHHRRSVEWLWHSEGGKGISVNTAFQGPFAMMAFYNLQQNPPDWDALDSLINGKPEIEAPPLPHVLIIDEINRANISKVFGELITLIEPDKRLGADNALTVKLPYSNKVFGVPANLHIIGTMNTADRSIALLDTALRRRFEFEEIAPEPELLEAAANATGIDLVAVLTGLNNQIEYLFDRDHLIGHAFFMNCRTKEDVGDVMRSKIIPLLAEYFYENWEKVRQVLGEMTNDGAFVSRTTLAPHAGIDGDGYADERWRYTVKSDFDLTAYDQLMA